MQSLQEIFFTNLNVVCNLGGFFKTKPDTDWSHSLHQFSQNKFYFITKGRCMIQIEDKIFTAQAGDWFYIPANTFHGYSNFKGETFEKYWMHFDLYPNNDLFHALHLPVIVNASGSREAYRLFKVFKSVHDSSELCDRIKEKSLLMALVAEYIRLALPDGITVKSINDSRIDEIIRYINTNISSSLTVSDLASEFHLHPNHFIRFFKNKTGQTPARYVKIKKMETAKRLLEDTDLTINEIIEKIGETDSSSFSKQFKSFYALSPREYRKFFLNTKHM